MTRVRGTSLLLIRQSQYFEIMLITSQRLTNLTISRKDDTGVASKRQKTQKYDTFESIMASMKCDVEVIESDDMNQKILEDAQMMKKVRSHTKLRYYF